MFLINRAPSLISNGKTPYEILFNVKPSYEHIKVFRCLCYVHNNQEPKDKFGEHSRRCIFVGYPYGKKGWKVYNIEDGTIIISWDVIFCEEVFPFPKEAVVQGRKSNYN